MAKAVDIIDGILFVRTRHYDNVKMVVVRHQEKPEKRFYKANEGEWKFTTHHARRYRICPFCASEKEDDRSSGWNFCWHCGARMKGGEKNGSDKQNTIDN